MLNSATHKTALILATTLFLVAALGVPSELMLQDTLKSALLAFGILSAALFFFWDQRSRTTPLRWHGLVWLPLALVGYALASMLWSHTYLAGGEAIRWFLFGLLLWLGLNLLTPGNTQWLLWGVHGGAVVAAAWAALQFWLDLDVFPQSRYPASTFINRNFLAEYLVCTLPFSVYLLARLRKSGWLWIMAASISLHVVALMMTGARSALLAMVFLLPVFVVLLHRYRQQLAWPRWSRLDKAMVCLVLLIGVGALGALPSGSPRVLAEGRGSTALERSYLRTVSMVDAKEYSERSFYTRSLMWKASARMLMDHPWAGVGAGAWEVQVPLFQRVGDTMETDYYPHNEFLQLLSEYGLVVGGSVLAVLVAYCLLTAGRTWRAQGAGLQDAALRGFTLCSLFALFVVSNAGFPWHLAATSALFALCLAILANTDVRLGYTGGFFASAMPWRHAAAGPTIAVLLCATALAAFIVAQAARVEYKLVKAIQIANVLMQSRELDATQRAELKARMLQNVREGIAINPHYRKLTAELAEPLAVGEDWENVAWILESVVASRPHISALWTGLAMGYSRMGQHARAHLALQQVQRLKPDAVSTHTLEAILLNRAGHTDQASSQLMAYFDKGLFDYDMVQTGYALGYQTHDWPLAIRALQLRIATWPEQAVDGYFRLGKLYAEPLVRDDAKSLAAFQAGLDAVPPDQKDNYRKQVPAAYRAGLR